MFAFVTKQPFIDVVDADLRSLAQDAAQEYPVRRPLLGVEAYQDTYAYLSVVSQVDGRPVYWGLLDQGSPTGLSSRWSNFIVEGIQERRMESMQVIKTFGRTHYQMFGQDPRFLMVSGKVVQGPNFNWAAEFTYNYENYLRGTRCAETQSRVILQVDGVIYEGMLVSMALDLSADFTALRPLTFNFAITDSRDTRVPATTGKPGAEYAQYRVSGPRGSVRIRDRVGDLFTASGTRLREGDDTERVPSESSTLRNYAEDGNVVMGHGVAGHDTFGPDGRSGTNVGQAKAYDHRGRLMPRARATNRGTGEDATPFLGRDQALLDIDLIIEGGAVEAGRRGPRRWRQREVGAHHLGAATTAQLLSAALTEGSVGGGVLRL